MKRILILSLWLFALAAHAEFGGTTPPQTSNLGATNQVLVNQGANAIPAWASITPSNITANSLTTASLDTSLDVFGRNYVINPQGVVAQRPNSGTFSANTLVYGACDRWLVGTGANVTAGQAIQGSALTLGQTQWSIQAFNVSTSNSSSVNFRQFIESKDAQELINKSTYLYATVYQNTGSAQTYTVNIYKANSVDFSGASITTTQTYTAMTLIGTQSINSVSSATATTFSAGPFTMGSCGNGVMVEIYCAYSGAITTKEFDLTDVAFQVANSTSATNTVRYRPYQQELALCQRYCYVINGATVGNFAQGATGSTSAVGTIITFPVTMRVAPTFSFSGTAGHVSCETWAGASLAVCTSFSTGSSTIYSTNFTLNNTGATWAAANTPQLILFNGSATSADAFVFNADF